MLYISQYMQADCVKCCLYPQIQKNCIQVLFQESDYGSHGNRAYPSLGPQMIQKSLIKGTFSFFLNLP